MDEDNKQTPQSSAQSGLDGRTATTLKPAETRPWWQEGVAIASSVTGWIVAPLLAALYGGQYLDTKYGTDNVFFLSLTGLAFIISCIGIARIGTRYMQSIEKSNHDRDRHSK